MKPITIVGAGFSGLSLAYYLNREGVPVRIVEKSARAGGLISSRRETHGLVETAANALLADQNVEDLFADLQLRFADREIFRRRRYIFWEKPRRWPLSLFTTLKMIRFYLPGHRPKPEETVNDWAERVINAQFSERLLAPALRGVYAGDPEQMSASLSLAAIFSSGKKGKLRGSVAPRGGMGELISTLEVRLKNSGVPIEYGRSFALADPIKDPVVLCTSAWAAADIVGSHDSNLAARLKTCESLPLITVTAFFEHRAQELKGFGVLFPQAQGFQALGVLFNDCIFSSRSSHRSETWIFGGADQSHDLSDEQIRQAILRDRLRFGLGDKPLSLHITRWPRALPHYTVAWEKTLRALEVKPPLYLHGNYLGALGLARIQQRSKDLAALLKERYAG